MTLEQANQLMRLCAEQMNTRYGKVVFDEWAIISFADEKTRLLAYSGPRKEGFQKNFASDVKALRASLLQSQNQAGDFDFTRDSVGTGFESFMALGNDLFLICNNTVQSMDAIAKDPLWLGAQVPFVELSERVQADPVTAA